MSLYCSLELGHGIAVALECSVSNVSANIYEIGHNGLIGGAIPLDIARFPIPVPVHVLVVLVEHGLLMVHPLFVDVGDGRVARQDAEQHKVGYVGVIQQRTHVPIVIVHHDRPVVFQTSAHTANQEVGDPAVHESCADVEVANWQLTDEHEAEDDAKLRASCI